MCGGKKGIAHHCQNNIPAVKYGGLGLFCYLRAWTDCYHQRKNELLILSRHFAGECKVFCPPIEARQRMGDATGQNSQGKK